MPVSGNVQIMHDWEKCDGFVKDVPTALIALSISCVVSIILILVIERMKLLFYQTAENNFEESTDISYNDRSKYL